ncbi:hypothetical protein BCR36DRAFT_414260 [Piromyces finnis]|uniref:Uncharacterized protein n=1 Tax=Piromyces finnis TaxID=1754191 RepID=A0A1Y1V2M9_9FUNG|nr:hypothetical protein BCR36DRAFT_414260 [Piromyces finnis]|eukprot:ORX45947.1 hypothetical protein BCR36DRAFT_414260 [Piromyces finnis]
MYSRSERNINFAKNSNPNIGPGTYQNTDDYEKPKNKGYASFNSLQPRISIFMEASSITNPSPNEYNTAPVPIDKAGRVVPFGRTNRFSYPKYVSPGPASYNIRQKIGNEKKELYIEKIGPKIGRLTMNSNVGYGYTPKIDYISVSEMVKDNNENNQTKAKNLNFTKNLINSTMDLDEEDDSCIIIKNNSSTKNKQNKNKQNNGNNNNVEKCNIIWKRKFVTPSIPYKNLTYGFVENQDGEIVPRKPPSHDDSIGPAFYNISSNNKVVSNNVYRGGFTFGNGLKEREVFKNIPGPGFYKTDVVTNSKKKNTFLFGGKSDRFSTINTLCNVQKNLRDNCAPGPGTYNIEPDEYNNTNYSYGMKLNGKSRLSKEDRFKDNFENNNSPGPGQYDIKNNYDPKIYHNVPSNKSYGFGTTSKRFPSSKISSNPGPGQYNYIGDSFNKTLINVNDEVPIIDDSGKLKAGIIINQNENNIYKIKSNKPMKYKSTQNSNDETVKIGFGTQHDRFEKYGETGNPAPGMYDSSRAFNMVKSHGKLGLTLKTRFDLNLEKNNNRLPPGLYSPSMPEKKSFHAPVHDESYMGKQLKYLSLFYILYKIKKLKQSERFYYKDNKLPGPSDYLSPRYDGGLIKKSFNVTYKDKEILK